MRIQWLLVVGVLAALSGCSDDAQSPAADPPSDSGGSPSTPTTSAPSTSDLTTSASPVSIWDSPVVDGTFSVGRDHVDLAIRCWGEGRPTILMEGGSGEGGLGRWEYNPVTEALAARTRVCAYDRAGAGESEAAAHHARGLDDVTRDLHDLLEAAHVDPPYLLTGISGGGFYAFQFAGRYPDGVAGLVMIETPPGQATMSPADIDELAWDAPGNLEHVDYVAVEHQMAVARLPIPAVPVTVVTGRYGQSADDLPGQRVWLDGAAPGRQVVLETGHEVDGDDPAGLIREILKVLTLAR